MKGFRFRALVLTGLRKIAKAQTNEGHEQHNVLHLAKDPNPILEP